MPSIGETLSEPISSAVDVIDEVGVTWGVAFNLAGNGFTMLLAISIDGVIFRGGICSPDRYPERNNTLPKMTTLTLRIITDKSILV
jgi:hypothetical protein